MYTNPYTFPRKFRSCLNCINLDKPEVKFCGIYHGGCRKRLLSFGVSEERLKYIYCGKWYLQQLKTEY